MGWAKYESPQLEEYANLKDMITNDAITFHHMRDRIDGTGFIVYDGSVYYNKVSIAVYFERLCVCHTCLHNDTL